MFNKLFGGDKTKTKSNTVEAVSPLSGTMVPLSEVPDEAFAQGYMGDGAAIEPSKGVVLAPFDGTISHLIDTHHAVIVEHASGLQLLIHVGINTVALKGEGFTAHVKTGDIVKAGQVLLAFDPERIKAAGFPIITPVIVASEDVAESVDCAYGDVIEGQPGAFLIHLKSSH